MATKRPYQPKIRRRVRVHGFRQRMSSADGRQVLKRQASERPHPAVCPQQQSRKARPLVGVYQRGGIPFARDNARCR